jgi:hypothetical protein
VHAVVFQDAVRNWNTSAVDNQGTFDAIIQIERLILSHRPTSVGEAVAMLDLVISEYECGPRSDELDRQALITIRDWLQIEDEAD